MNNPNDPMVVLSKIPADTTPDQIFGDYLVFEGVNWKLSSDKKWEPRKLPIDESRNQVIGGRLINGALHKIARYGEAFIAYQ
jgi:hypothetical protein